MKAYSSRTFTLVVLQCLFVFIVVLSCIDAFAPKGIVFLQSSLKKSRNSYSSHVNNEINSIVVLHAKSRKEVYTRSVPVEGDEMSDEFAKWEEEERELQLEELKEQAKIDGEGDGSTLPDYMLRMIAQFSTPALEEIQNPTPAGTVLIN